MSDISILAGVPKKFAYDGKNLLAISLTNNWVYANIYRIDSFTFITKENRLQKNTDLIFYNNPKDDRCIITEKEELELNYGDIELEINLKDNRLEDELIEIYLQIVYYAKQKSIFDFFKKKEIEITIEFEILDEFGNKLLQGKAKIPISKTIKLMNINKINNSVAEILFCPENLETSIEEIINHKI